MDAAFVALRVGHLGDRLLDAVPPLPSIMTFHWLDGSPRILWGINGPMSLLRLPKCFQDRMFQESELLEDREVQSRHRGLLGLWRSKCSGGPRGQVDGLREGYLPASVAGLP